MYQNLRNSTCNPPITTHLIQKCILETPYTVLWSLTDNAVAYHLLPHDNLVGLCCELNMSDTKKYLTTPCNSHF